MKVGGVVRESMYEAHNINVLMVLSTLYLHPSRSVGLEPKSCTTILVQKPGVDNPDA